MFIEEKLVDSIEIGRKVLEAEAQALLALSASLDGNLVRTCEIILKHSGKVVTTGMGKSGHVAQKIASTLCSTGTSSVYLHPAEAVHGDLGIYSPGDPTILLSKSGSTVELMRLIPTLRQFKSPIIAMVSKGSPIAQKADVVLEISVSVEADPLGIVPTSSALVMMAMGDVLASVLMKARGFEKKDFARLHPGGQLGRNLLYNVEAVMHKADKVFLVGLDATLHEVVVGMTEAPLGAACVLDSNGDLLGVVTDGDIRRVLLNPKEIQNVNAESIMTRNPICATPEMMLADAVRLMEDRVSQISVLPVVAEDSKRFLGLIRLHDVYQQH